MALSNHEVPKFNEFLKSRNFATLGDLKNYRTVAGSRTIFQELAMVNAAENLSLILKTLTEEEMKSLIIEKGNDFFGNTPLMWAVANSSIDAALTLIELGSENQLNILDRQKRTPLIFSIIKGRNHVDDGKRCARSQGEFISTLLKTKAQHLNINQKDDIGRTALHYAFLHQDIDTIILLIKNGAIFSRDKNGQLPDDMIISDPTLIKDQLRKIVLHNTIKGNILPKEDFLKELDIQLKNYGLLLPTMENDQTIVISDSLIQPANAKTEQCDFLWHKQFLLIPSPIKEVNINLPIQNQNIPKQKLVLEQTNASNRSVL